MEGYIKLDKLRKLDISLQTFIALEGHGINVMDMQGSKVAPISTMFTVVLVSLQADDPKLTMNKLATLVHDHSNALELGTATEYVLRAVMEWHLGMTFEEAAAQLKAKEEAEVMPLEAVDEESKND